MLPQVSCLGFLEDFAVLVDGIAPLGPSCVADEAILHFLLLFELFLHLRDLLLQPLDRFLPLVKLLFLLLDHDLLICELLFLLSDFFLLSFGVLQVPLERTFSEAHADVR